METANIKSILAGHAVQFTAMPGTIRDALPFGNGRFGGLHYRPGHWEWIINKLDVDIDLWKDAKRDDPANMVTDRVFVDATSRYRDVLRAVEAKDAESLQALHQEEGRRKKQTPQTIGKLADYAGWTNPENVVPAFLRVHMQSNQPPAFHEMLDLYRGEIRAQCAESGCRYAATTVCDPDADRMSIAFKATKGALPVDYLALHRKPHGFFLETRPHFGCQGDCFWVDYTFANNYRYVVMVRIVDADFRHAMKADEICVRLKKPVRHLTLLVACATILEAPDPVAACRSLVQAARPNAMARRNAAYWAAYWSKSAIRIDDDFMENLYYIHQYMFGCTHAGGIRAKFKAAGLYGLWTESDHLAWMNRPYGDINIEAAYQPLFSSNRPELFEAFVDMVWAFLDTARRRARHVFNLPGACFETPLHCMGPWYCSLLWDHYLYTCDERYLRERAYPIMKEVGEFSAAFLRKDALGNYYSFGTMVPERSVGTDTPPGTMFFGMYCKNVTIDLALQKRLFKALITCAHLLNKDQDQAGRWQDILDHFPAYSTGQTPYGKTIFDMEEFNSPEMCHHPNTLAPVFPAREFHFSSPPAEAELARATVLSCWDNIRYYYTFNSPWVATAMARLGLGDRAAEVLSTRVVDLFTDPSGILGREIGRYYTGFKSMAFGPRVGNPPLHEVGAGLVTAINEMLVQEQAGVLYVFPALPVTWRKAAFDKLRIPGAFLVSAEYADGRTARVRIKAEKDGTLKVRNPWSSRTIRLVSAAGIRAIDAAEDGLLSLSFQAGEKLTLTSSAESPPADSGPTPPVPRPKRHKTLAGYHVFIGKDPCTQVLDAVEQFCYPAMISLGVFQTLFNGSVPRQFLEIPQNVYFKLNFGAPQKTGYGEFADLARMGDRPFSAVLPDTCYSEVRRYGWSSARDLKRVTCRAGSDVLTRSAIESAEESVLTLKLDEGAYQFLLLHGNGRGLGTRCAFPQLGADFVFDAPDDALSIDGFGVRVPAEMAVDLHLCAGRGRRWRVNALLIKRVW